MRIKTTDGRVFEGTAKQVVETMQSIGFGADDRSLGEYIDSMVGNIERLQGVRVEVTGESDDERAAAFLRGLVEAGLAEKI